VGNLVASPKFKKYSIFNENLAAIEMIQTDFFNVHVFVH